MRAQRGLFKSIAQQTIMLKVMEADYEIKIKKLDGGSVNK